MENIKFYIITLLLVAAAGFLGYGAINSLRDPVYYLNNQTLATVGNLEENNSQTTNSNISTEQDVSQGENTETPISPNTQPTTEIPSEPTTITPAPAPTETSTSLATQSGVKSALEKIPSGTTIKKGDSGEQVKAIQTALNMVAKSGLPTSGTGYGTFGNQTETAVKKFQTDNKISPASGQVASKTLAALIAKLK